ncbi:hypothetical protein PCASD_15130 [Puccinia coronata f. sp. avenae]|uniref:Uncharacterized protein n=1 Tax=Puccinia coronata f. sp. avenae TaxID=200324 RepID=A0A2N5T9E8_9BASI|nr:hypothetical protein PCASD_15130 [Puccinia coronata f. sp. avenae]
MELYRLDTTSGLPYCLPSGIWCAAYPGIELALAVTHSLPLVQWTLRLGYEGWRSVAFQRATVRRSINQTHYEAFQVTYPT